MLQAQQQWAIAPADDAGGYPGAPYFRVTIAGTGRALAATAEREIEVVPAFAGSPEQLWRIEQLTDGSWRLMPKSVPGSDRTFALSAVGASKPTLEPYDATSDRQRWRIRLP
jgi:arabinan endo-1,5-alpha-L-arabinosidase